MKYKLLSLLLGIAIIGGLAATLYAQTGQNGLRISPSNFDLTINPNQATTGTIHFDNLTNQPLLIRVDTRNFTAKGEEGDIVFSDTAQSFSLASWITVTPSQLQIPAKTSRDFNFIIKPPQDAEPGGHFGSIVFATVPDKTLQGSGAQLSEEVGAILLVKIPGNVNEEATLESFTPDKQIYWSGGPVQFTTRVHNKSTVHIRPVGSIVITDILGNKYDVSFEQRNVLPNAVRKIPGAWDKHFLLGKYNASIILAYGAKNQNLYATTVFYAFPVKEAGILFVALLILYIMRKRLRKSLKALMTGK